MRPFLWVPGKFSLTNKMLDNLRAGSRYQGAHPPRGWVNAFEQETQAIRLATKSAANRARLEVPQTGKACHVGFIVCGHHKHDCDAWYLLGKAALDGLVDAGVFESDRFEVLSTKGRVLRTADEEERVAQLWGMASNEGPGLLIELEWVPRPAWCNHV